MKKIAILLTGILLAISATTVQAGDGSSEGTVELRSIDGSSSRCWAGSVLMTGGAYSVIFSCRDLVHAKGVDVYNYTLWGKDKSNAAFRLSRVGNGKGQISTDKDFTGMFVTRENDDNPRVPSTNVIMQGSTKSLSFLDRFDGQAAATPEIKATPTVTENVTDRVTAPLNPDGQSTQVGALTAVKIVGGVVVVVILLVIVIALVSASRRRPVDL